MGFVTRGNCSARENNPETAGASSSLRANGSRAKRGPMTGSAKQSGATRAALDCNDDETNSRILAAGTPEFCVNSTLEKRGRRESRMHAAPAASCARWKVESTRENTGTPKHSGLPCAMVLRLIARSPRCPGLIATVACRVSSANLIPASGNRDHTPLPSAGRIPRQMMQPASIASRPTSVTTRTPLRSGRDKASIIHISEKRKQNISSVRGWGSGSI